MSPVRHRLRQLSGISRAVELIDPSREYPFSFVCFHITGYRSRQSKDDVLLDGKDLIEDLVDLADQLTAEHPLPTNAREQSLDIDGLAKRFRISTKTVSRWRRRGLLGIWQSNSNGTPHLVFTNSAIQRFVGRNLDLVRRGSSFQFMSDGERAQIIARARELIAVEKCSLHAITLRLAEETGRAVETIRYSLRRWDRDHPQEALFDQAEQPRELDESEVIYQAYVDGTPLDEIAARFEKREADIRRILTCARAEELAKTPIDYIHSDAFSDDESLLPDDDDDEMQNEDGDDEDADANVTLNRVPSNLPPYLQELYRTPLLTRNQEARFFERMNQHLHWAETARQKLTKDVSRTTVAQIAQIDGLLARAKEIKNRITQANLRLVVSIAKRHLSGRDSRNLFELVSDGNLALMRAVEKFDYTRGFRFSTYASWAIMRSFARSIPDEITQVDRFRTGQEEVLASIRDHRAASAQVGSEAADARLKAVVSQGLSSLDARERIILEHHFGLNERAPKTLDEIGKKIGVSKERVRQIELRAMQKLRLALGDGGAELLAG